MNVVFSDEDIARLADALAVRLAGRVGTEPNRLLTYAEAAVMLKVSVASLKNLIYSGKLRKAPGTNKGLVALSEVQRFMEGGAA